MPFVLIVACKRVQFSQTESLSLTRQPDNLHSLSVP